MIRGLNAALLPWERQECSLERMAGTTRLELATSAVTGFYNNLQDCGDCQKPRKSLKIAQEVACCGLDCGLKVFS